MSAVATGGRLEESRLWKVEEELAAAIGVEVQRGGDLLERTAAVLSTEDPPIYRYMLTREWEPDAPVGVWIMANPSIADGLRNDRTINRCRGHSRQWGLGGMVAVNACAYRSTDPDELLGNEAAIGPHNELFLDVCTSQRVRRGGPVIAAWGTHQAVKERGKQVARMLVDAGVELTCVKVTQAGHPGHPGRLAATLPLLPYEPAL